MHVEKAHSQTMMSALVKFCLLVLYNVSLFISACELSCKNGTCSISRPLL